MGSILGTIRYILVTIKIKYLCKRYNISEGEAKKLVKKKNRKVRRGAKEIVALIRKRKVLAITLAISILITLFSGITYIAVSDINKQQMMAVAAYNSSRRAIDIEGEYTIFTGEAECDLYGVGGLSIPAEKLNEYGVQCNGKYALGITYTSKEVYNFTKDEDKKTIIAHEKTDRENSDSVIESTETLEEELENDVISTEQLDMMGYRSNTSYFSHCYSATELELTQETEEYELVFHSGEESILEKGTYLTGYNWVITQVKIIDIEKRRNWLIKNGYNEEIDGGETESGGTTDGEQEFNPQSLELKNWNQLFKDLEDGCNAVNSDICKPYTIVGTYLREVNTYLVNDLNSDKWQYDKDLARSINDEYSNKASGEVLDSINGWGQWNKTTWESHRMKYGDTSPQGLELDSQLNYYRPNCWYGKDQAWTTAVSNMNFALNSKAYKNAQSNGQWDTISNEDKAFIVGFINETYHNRGQKYVNQNTQNIDKHINDLITIAAAKANYGINSLFDMAEAAGVEVYNESKRVYTGGGIEYSDKNKKIIDNKQAYSLKFGIDWTSDNQTSNRVYQEYAYINALCAGWQCWNSVRAQIAADTPQTPDTGGGTGGGLTNSDRVVAMAQHVWDTWQAEGCTYYSQKDWYRTKSYGTIRPDCSGYVSCVMWQLGYMDKYRAITSRDYAKNAIGWQVVGYGTSVQLQPGDILAYNGHVQIFAGYDSNGKRLWYSWGNNAAARGPAPTTSADSHFKDSKNFVILRAP